MRPNKEMNLVKYISIQKSYTTNFADVDWLLLRDCSSAADADLWPASINWHGLKIGLHLYSSDLDTDTDPNCDLDPHSFTYRSWTCHFHQGGENWRIL